MPSLLDPSLLPPAPYTPHSEAASPCHLRGGNQQSTGPSGFRTSGAVPRALPAMDTSAPRFSSPSSGGSAPATGPAGSGLSATGEAAAHSQPSCRSPGPRSPKCGARGFLDGSALEPSTVPRACSQRQGLGETSLDSYIPARNERPSAPKPPLTSPEKRPEKRDTTCFLDPHALWSVTAGRAPAGGSVVRGPACAPKACGFDSPSRAHTRVQFNPSPGRARASLTSTSLSPLPPCHPLSLELNG